MRFSSNGAIALTLVCLLMLIGSLVPHLRPSTEAVRLRNALLFDQALAEDFNWTPQSVPASFATDRTAPRTALSDATKALLPAADESDWEKSLRIARHLVRNASRGGAAMSDLEGTYEIILQGGGYCADFTTTFIAMARSAGIFAREWAFSFDGYGGHGHALIEVYDRSSQQWRMMDVFNNFYAVDTASGRPLSAQEFRQHVAAAGDGVTLLRIGPGREGFPNHESLYSYYRGGADQWYLWWGNAVYTYDASAATRLLGNLSRSAEQLGAIVLGVHPRIRALPTATNVPLREAAMRLRWQLLAKAVAGTLLTLLLVAQLAGRWRARRHRYA